MNKVYFLTVIIYGVLFAKPYGFAEVLPPLIKVSSFCEKSISPNFAIIQVQAWGKSTKANEAKELVNIQIQKFKVLATKFKIKNEQIQTDDFQVGPEYSYDQKNSVTRIVGYSATQSLTVTLKNMEDVGSFTAQVVSGDAAKKSGLSLINLSWDSDQKSQTEFECISDAVKSGRVRAEEMAKAAGVKIKSVYSMTNQQVFINHEQAQAKMMNNAARGMMESLSSGESATDLSPGKIKIRTEVYAEYQIQN